MIDGALPYLRCPVCGEPLNRADRSLRCPRGHGFDIARQGYVNLTAGRSPHSGDTVEMIADRETFLAAGHYDFIAAALAGTVRPGDGLVLDAGTGTGHYLARVLDALPGTPGLGIDVSKPALRRAARAHPRAGAALADLWRPLPLRDAAASILINVFAPRNGPEFRRVLHQDGLLLVVTPAPDHLAELIDAYGLISVDPEKTARVTESLGPSFREQGTTTLRHSMHLTAAETRTLIGMTPSARHLEVQDIEASEITATAAVNLTLYGPA
ncbi:putative RNA methyltransferase [Amorphoplanes digitatis]|uniref:23S rRNA (Guanine745-N1)-methyltransferase n=1 Tax=Actinoplanes digitatis TaxID=1868 RepID=A0A7W7MMN0_9ACTN|nr:23S rRNA methyltransferase [Actinoplanes digitatis]MBB4759817.1 23S rRNA (guanine745-N1)-methyltransferase [Actinoplanes digitatis]GID94423.1 ubiquinone biosynthesis protein [Actinoplanes digitatis]